MSFACIIGFDCKHCGLDSLNMCVGFSSFIFIMVDFLG
jgi:hypothetical protein